MKQTEIYFYILLGDLIEMNIFDDIIENFKWDYRMIIKDKLNERN